MISPDTIPLRDELAAGPGIRAWEIARGLERCGHAVTLAMPKDLFKNQKADIKIIPWELSSLKTISKGFDCVVVPQGRGDLAKAYAETVSSDIPTVVDVYDPVLVEFLSVRTKDKAGLENASLYLSEIVPLLKRGDFFICANERQRYYYIGILNVLGRINPLTFDQKILDIVPFGVPDEKPVHTKNVLKGKLVDRDDLVILWFSGIYPWFDAATLVKAMPDIVEEIPHAKLIFMGGVHPRLHAPADEYERTRKEAKKTGLLDRAIFFTEWRPYDERANWYLESDVAVCTYKDTLETLLSHRTRIIDLLWGGLPVVVSAGDEVSQMVTSRGCGLSVEVGEKKALSRAVISLLEDEALRRQMRENARKLVEEELVWDRVLKPLDDFCQNPRLAPDRMDADAGDSIVSAVDTLEAHQKFLVYLKQKRISDQVEKVKKIYSDEGARGIVRRISWRLQDKLKDLKGD